MPVNISEIEPFERLRDLMGFYTTEASRAQVTVSTMRAHVRYLQGRLRRRRGLISSSEAKTKWQAEALFDSDSTALELYDEIEEYENTIDIMKSLHETYVRYYDVLSRELTARSNDRDRWYGRGGDGR